MAIAGSVKGKKGGKGRIGREEVEGEHEDEDEEEDEDEHEEDEVKGDGGDKFDEFTMSVDNLVIRGSASVKAVI